MSADSYKCNGSVFTTYSFPVSINTNTYFHLALLFATGTDLLTHIYFTTVGKINIVT